MLASGSGHTNIVEKLISAGVNTNLKNKVRVSKMACR